MKPGLGVMLFMLGGGSKHSSEEYVGKKIAKANFHEEHLYIDFEDGVQIRMFDNGQSCCEHRYMTCDDDVNDLVGHNWISADVQDGPSLKDEDEQYAEDHDQQFLVIKTSGATITIANHNEHNGYYGGFGLTIEEREKDS